MLESLDLAQHVLLETCVRDRENGWCHSGGWQNVAPRGRGHAGQDLAFPQPPHAVGEMAVACAEQHQLL